MRNLLALAAVVLLAVMASGCSLKWGDFEIQPVLPGQTSIRIARTYDESGILTENGDFDGTLDEAKGGFQLSRSDQKGDSKIEERAGANAEWTSQAGQMTVQEFFSSLRVMGALFAATQGLPAGMNINSGPPMVMNIPAAPPVKPDDKPTTGGP